MLRHERVKYIERDPLDSFHFKASKLLLQWIPSTFIAANPSETPGPRQEEEKAKATRRKTKQRLVLWHPFCNAGGSTTPSSTNLFKSRWDQNNYAPENIGAGRGWTHSDCANSSKLCLFCASFGMEAGDVPTGASSHSKPGCPGTGPALHLKTFFFFFSPYENCHIVYQTGFF